jgi:hypothetical protein
MGLDGYIVVTAVFLQGYYASIEFLSDLWRQVQGG